MLREATFTLLLAAALAVSGMATGVLPGEPTSSSDESAEAQQGTEISFTRQESDGTTVVVERVNLRRGGFVVIHDTTVEPPDGDLVGSVIGVSRYLGAGVHTNVTVTLSEPVNATGGEPSVRVIAMPHRDTNGNQVFDFVIANATVDGPYSSDGTPIADPATLDLADGPLPPEASLSFQNQSVGGGTVTVNAATLADGGFIAIVDEDGDVIGVSQYLEAETQRTVRIRLVSRPDGTANLTARAHRDTDGDRVFGFVHADGAVDGPYRAGTPTDTAQVRARGGGSASTATGSPTGTFTATGTARR